MLKYFFVICVLSPCVLLAPLELTPDAETTPIVTITTKAPVKEATTVQPESSTPRRLINYDQRQDGKYNIRADLENFVILVVPQSQSAGLNILDLLTKSAGKKAHSKHSHKKHSAVVETPASVPIQPQQLRVTKPNNIADHFVEGRTPYRVDISSIEPESRVDPVPKLTLSHPGSSPSGKNFIRFEVESPPFPSIVPTQGNNINYNHYKSKQYSRQIPESSGPGDGGSSIRINKSFHDSELISKPNDNILLTQNNLSNEVADINIEAIFNRLNISSLDALNSAVDHQNYKGADLILIGAHEQCGPNRQRDSYGVCQFII